MDVVRDCSGPLPARCKRAFLSFSLLLVAMVGCSDDGNGSPGSGTGDTDQTSTGATGTTGGDDTGSTGGTGTTDGTGATGDTGDDQPPPELSISLASACSLQANPNAGSFDGPYLLVFDIQVENVGGPYDASTFAVSTHGQPPLSGSFDSIVGYQDSLTVTVGHDLDESDLGLTGIIEIKAYQTTRGLRVSVPDGSGSAPCNLT